MSHLIRSNNIFYEKTSRLTKGKEQREHKARQDGLVSQVAGEKYQSEMVEKTFYEAEIQRMEVKLEQVYEEAKKQGFDEGKKIGLKEGLKQGEENGFIAGQGAGEKKGIEKARAEVAQEHGISTDNVKKQSEILIQVLNDLNSQVNDEIKYFESIGVEIIYEVLLKIIGARVVEKKLIEEVLSQCLNKCVLSKVVKIKVSLEDYQLILLKKLGSKLLSLLEHIEVIPDVQVLPGGCIVETNSGSLDARLESQLEIFKEYLLEVYQQSQVKEGTLT